MLECPKSVSEPTETSLNLIPNADDVFLSQNLIDLLVEVGRRDDLPSAAEHIFRNEGAVLLSDHILEVLFVVLHRIG